MGTAEVAAENIVMPVERILMSFFYGVGNAASVMIGNQIGAGREDNAFFYAKKFVVLAILGAMVGGGLVLLGAPAILSLFKVSQEVHYFAARIFYVVSFVLWIKIFNMLTATGIFRGGGDTTFTMLMDLSGVWGIGVPLAILGAFVFHLPVYHVFLLVCLGEVYVMLLGLWRLYSKRWIHNLVQNTTTN
jgi:Na+-driven multidrug efflux pump